MTNEQIQEQLNAAYPNMLSDWDTTFGMLSFSVPAAYALEVIQHLFHNEALQFQFLTDLTVVHYPDRLGQELCVVYHLHNLVANVRLRIKAYVPIAQPDITSLTALYAGANWLEREAYDFFGVNFVGHPNLTRIMNVDEMDYFPMRKEYPMEDPTRIDKDDDMFGR
jgi:NADH-quinone oxidoreductase subunit C